MHWKDAAHLKGVIWISSSISPDGVIFIQSKNHGAFSKTQSNIMLKLLSGSKWELVLKENNALTLNYYGFSLWSFIWGVCSDQSDCCQMVASFMRSVQVEDPLSPIVFISNCFELVDDYYCQAVLTLKALKFCQTGRPLMQLWLLPIMKWGFEWQMRQVSLFCAYRFCVKVGVIRK